VAEEGDSQRKVGQGHQALHFEELCQRLLFDDVGDGSEEALGLHIGALLLTREDEHLDRVSEVAQSILTKSLGHSVQQSRVEVES